MAICTLDIVYQLHRVPPSHRRAPTWHGALLATLLLVGSAARAEVTEELIRLPSVGSAVLPVLISHDESIPTRATAVLFNGGGGVVGLLRRVPRPGANFLVRSRSAFAERGVATAVIDVPTDLSELSDAVRMSRRHADDVRAVLRWLRERFPDRPVYLIGTSRGTVSAAYAGAALGDDVAGVVLTSTVFNATRGGPGVSGFDWSALRARVLFVHHADDACLATPYAMAQRVARGRTLVTAHGGDPPRSEPCEPYSPHGYHGIEVPVVGAIVQWLNGEMPPTDVP